MSFSLVLATVACAAPAKNSSSTPTDGRSMTMHKPRSVQEPTETFRTAPPPQGHANVVAFVNLGYKVHVPEGWAYKTNVSAGGDMFDIVLTHEESGTSVNVSAYVDNERQDFRLTDIVWFYAERMRRAGTIVGSETYDVTDTAYSVEYSAERPVPGRLMMFRVLVCRLHRVPGPAFVVFGVSPDRSEEFMRKSVDEVVSGIEPYSGDEGR